MYNYLTLFFLLFIQVEATVRILTFHCNRPDFIELQHKTLQKFMEDDYELIVFNDAKTEQLEIEIREMCEKHQILCVRFEQYWHEIDPLNDQITTWLRDPVNRSGITFEKEGAPAQPSIRHCHVIQYALDHFGYDHDDVVVLLDGDCFPIRPCSFRKLLGDDHIAGIHRVAGDIPGLDYLWVVCTFFNPMKLPDRYNLKFNVTIIERILWDTGTQLYYYVKNHPEVKVKNWYVQHSIDYKETSDELLLLSNFTDKEIKLTKALSWPNSVEFHLDHLFLHFSASTWSYHGYEEKHRLVHEFINSILTN